MVKKPDIAVVAKPTRAKKTVGVIESQKTLLLPAKTKTRSLSLSESSSLVLADANSAAVPLALDPEDNGGKVFNKKYSEINIIPVKNTVLFPHNVLPLTANKDWNNEAVEKSIRSGGVLGVLAQRDPNKESPRGEDLYDIGTEAKILKVIRFPDGSYGAVVQGLRRFKVMSYVNENSTHMVARVEYISEVESQTSIEIMALSKGLKQLIQRAITLSPNVPSEAVLFIENVSDAGYLSDLVIPYLSVDVEAKQELLEMEDDASRLRKVHYLLTREIEILEVSQKIHSEVRSEVGKQQRKYYVKEQMRLLQKELGELDGKTSGATGNELVDLRARLEKSLMPQEAREAAERELDRMGMMQSGSPEYMVSFTYAGWLLDLPWGQFNQKSIDLTKAKAVLNEDHYGLEKVKKRVLEFLAVYALKETLKGPILLLLGPPGVGKTSLGKSVARALGRKFVRIALGGVRDEAEIRGHRRTYIGSMPGKFADALKKAGSMDPVILLDEVDKIAADQRGDPASALLEVLDSEQNSTFTDHYLNIPLDLSKVMFIATANSLHSIPGPLRDRMEVIDLSGYTLDEKNHIAFDHLLPQVLEEHGLTKRAHVTILPTVMKNIIQQYSREAGVRQLKRDLAGIARNIAREVVESDAKTKEKKIIVKRRNITMNDVSEFLGPPIYLDTARSASLPFGVSLGLAYTPVGGDVLFIESALTPNGTGKLSLTGQLGDVMKESVITALTFIKANATACGVPQNASQKEDIHVHFPAGAIKKDGPSAGTAVFCALVSLLSQKNISPDLAMTGEISLRGDVLPVGGIKEKLMAAHRLGIKKVLIPFENKKDLHDFPADVLKELEVVGVKTLPEVLGHAFGKKTREPLVRKKNAR